MDDFNGDALALLEACTHLVCDKPTRTEKFLLALTLGKFIVGKPFLAASKRVGIWVDPEKYLVQDETLEAKYKFDLEESATMARKNKCLIGKKFFCTPNTCPDRDILERLIEAAGGTVRLH